MTNAAVAKRNHVTSLAMTKKTPNPIDVHVGSRIRARRTMHGMSQEKLGDALGITFQQVQKYEKGTNRVGASRLQHISSVLNVPISYFFEGSPSAPGEVSTPPDEGLAAFLVTTEGLALNRAFVNIRDAKVRKKTLALIKSLGGMADTDLADNDND